MGNEAITIPLDQVPKPRPPPEDLDDKKRKKWDKDEKKRVDKETKDLTWKLQKEANQEQRRINREKRTEKQQDRDEKRAIYRDKQRDKKLREEGFRDKISGWEHFTYNTHFYGRVLRLKIESKIVQDKIDAKKGAMGLTIYDSFEQEDTAGAEGLFMKCEQEIEALELKLRTKEKELEELRTHGESDAVFRPKLVGASADA